MVRSVSCWKAAPAGLAKPSMSSAASLPTRNPPLHMVCSPFEVSEIVAYSPFPIFRTDAKPLSTMGICEIRESAINDSASTGNGSKRYAAISALHCELRPRKSRREERCATAGPEEAIETSGWEDCEIRSPSLDAELSAGLL